MVKNASNLKLIPDTGEQTF